MVTLGEMYNIYEVYLHRQESKSSLISQPLMIDEMSDENLRKQAYSIPKQVLESARRQELKKFHRTLCDLWAMGQQCQLH